MSKASQAFGCAKFEPHFSTTLTRSYIYICIYAFMIWDFTLFTNFLFFCLGQFFERIWLNLCLILIYFAPKPPLIYLSDCFGADGSTSPTAGPKASCIRKSWRNRGSSAGTHSFSPTALSVQWSRPGAQIQGSPLTEPLQGHCRSSPWIPPNSAQLTIFDRSET